MAEPRGSRAAGFKSAAATGGDWAAAAKDCLDALGALPQGANLGLLYATAELANHLGDILAFLQARTGVEDWSGTVGLGVAASGTEYHGVPALAVLVAALPGDGYRILPTLRDSLEPLRQSCGAWLAQRTPLFGIAHGDPRNPHVAEIVASLSNETSVFLAGGLTASQSGFPQIAGGVTEGGLSGVLFAPELPVVCGLSQGCTPIGGVRSITEAEDNVIKSIDGRPAFEVFREDIGELLARDLSRVAGYIFAAFPIAGTDTGDYLVRNLTGIDPERGWIAVGETVAAGQPIMFCRRDHAAAVEDLKRMLADVKKRAGGAPKAALYYSCVARGPNLFGPDSEELKLIRDELGDLPLAGFFGNGEISNNRLYGYTGVLALFL